MNLTETLLALYKSLEEIKLWDNTNDMCDELEVLIGMIEFDIEEMDDSTKVIYRTEITYYYDVQSILDNIIDYRINYNAKEIIKELHKCTEILEELDYDFKKIDPDYRDY